MPALESKPAHSLAVFISYALPDAEWCEKLRKHLALLERQKHIINWSREGVPAGEERETVVAEKLNTAHIILLLISPNFIASDQCYDFEMKRALERHKAGEVHVIPVLLGDVASLEDTPLETLQFLPRDGKSIKASSNPEKVLAEIARDIRAVVKELSYSTDRTNTAYRNILSQSPSTHPNAIVQRVELVRQLYTKIMQPGISGLVLIGMGGIGKSTLAGLIYHYAEEQRSKSLSPLPGKTLWLKIDANVTLVDILGTLQEALDLPIADFAHLTTEYLVRELIRTLNTAVQPCLVVLNQFETLLNPQTGRERVEGLGVSAWLDALNSQPGSCRILLTSRFPPRGTQSYSAQCLQEYIVPAFTTEEGDKLLRLRGVHPTEDETHVAVERCQGHALALEWLSRLLIDNPGAHIASFFELPFYARQRTEVMAEELLNHIFAQQLNQSQRELLVAFSIYREAVPVEAAQAIVEIYGSAALENTPSAHRILLAHRLLFAVGEMRYQPHPLATEFVQKYFVLHNGQPGLYREHAAAMNYYQQRAMLFAPPRKLRRSIDDIHDFVEAAWHACQAGQLQEAYDLIVKENIFLYLLHRGYNSVLLELYQGLLPTKARPLPLETTAHIYNEIGEIYQVLGQKRKAQYYLELAVQNFRALGERQGMVTALNNLGAVYRQQDQDEEALVCYQEAKRLADETEEKIIGKGVTLNNLGYIAYAAGLRVHKSGYAEQERQYYEQALEYYQAALPLHHADEQFAEEARTLNNIGEVYQALKREEEAYVYHQQALELAREQGNRWVEAVALNDLGLLSKKRPQMAATTLEYYGQARAIFHEIGARQDERMVLRNLGFWFLLSPQEEKDGALQEKRYDIILACFVLARNIFNELYSPRKDEIPRLVVHELRLALGEQGLQTLLSDVEERAEQIVEQALQGI